MKNQLLLCPVPTSWTPPRHDQTCYKPSFLAFRRGWETATPFTKPAQQRCPAPGCPCSHSPLFQRPEPPTLAHEKKGKQTIRARGLQETLVFLCKAFCVWGTLLQQALWSQYGRGQPRACNGRAGWWGGTQRGEKWKEKGKLGGK